VVIAPFVLRRGSKIAGRERRYMFFTIMAIIAATLGSPLGPLYEIFGARESCVWNDHKNPPYHFTSESQFSPDKVFLIQWNHAPGFSEIIVYTYDKQSHRFARTQLDDQGRYAAATSPGPIDGEWTFTNVPTKLRSDRGSIVFRATRNGETDHEPGVAGAGTCVKF
jgi:hypothetical protein